MENEGAAASCGGGGSSSGGDGDASSEERSGRGWSPCRVAGSTGVDALGQGGMTGDSTGGGCWITSTSGMDGTAGSAAGASHVGPVAGAGVDTTGSEARGGAAVDCAGGGGGETSASLKAGLGGASVST